LCGETQVVTQRLSALRFREAAARRRSRSSIAEEVERLAADGVDREEMQIIREQMADLAPESLG
jgi:hypothetical protein